VVELLRPEQPGEGLPHDVARVGRQVLRDDRGVELVRIQLALGEDALELFAEGARGKLSVGEPQAHGRRLARFDSQGVKSRRLRPSLFGVDGLRA
jgi:hypothetical protein